MKLLCWVLCRLGWLIIAEAIDFFRPLAREKRIYDRTSKDVKWNK